LFLRHDRVELVIGKEIVRQVHVAEIADNFMERPGANIQRDDPRWSTQECPKQPLEPALV